MWSEGRLLHTFKAGVAKVEGMLEDYAYVGLGLVELYRLTGELADLDWARECLEAILERFHDEEAGGFFETAADGEQLILRQKAFFDAATPSGNGATALLALWLGRYYVREDWERVAAEVIGQVADHLLAAVTGFGTILQALEFLMAPPREVVIVGEAEARAPFEREVGQRFLPWVVVASTETAEGLPHFEGRQPGLGGEAVAFVCEDRVCNLPATTPAELAEQLG